MTELDQVLTNKKIDIAEDLNRLVERSHTMGHLLPKYVLPKLPPREVLEKTQVVSIIHSLNIQDFISFGKSGHKKFNWRRPHFIHEEKHLKCIMPPGVDYTHHYVQLFETAAKFYGTQLSFQRPPLAPEQGLEFVRSLVRDDIEPSDVVILGYVEHLFAPSDLIWEVQNGIGYRTFSIGDFKILLIGFELSYWGDIGGHLIRVLAEKNVSEWVIYVGKLGALDQSVIPNRTVATGNISLLEGREISWKGRLNVDLSSIETEIHLLTGQTHVTEPSTLDESVEWLKEFSLRADLVDPEIGRMAVAATESGIAFDYLHIVSDNLAGGYEHGLFEEHFGEVKSSRRECLKLIEDILTQSFVR